MTWNRTNPECSTLRTAFFELRVLRFPDGWGLWNPCFLTRGTQVTHPSRELAEDAAIISAQTALVECYEALHALQTATTLPVEAGTPQP